MNFRDASKQEHVREGEKIGRGDGQSFSEGKTTRHNYKFIPLTQSEISSWKFGIQRLKLKLIIFRL